MNTQNYAVNIRVGLANPARVNISQGDTGRTLAFSLYDGLSPFTPPTGSTVTIVGRKPSKLGFSETCTVSGNVATVATTLAMTQEAGKFPAELRIEAGGQSIGTANFTMYVEPSPHPDGTTDGTHDTMDNLQTQITSLQTDIVELQSGGYVADAQQIQAKINAWLVEHPEATTTVQNGAITRAKLNNSVGAVVDSVTGIVQYNVAEIGLDNLQVTSNSLVYFPTGVYEIDMDKRITLTNVKNVRIVGYGATIKLKNQEEIKGVGAGHTYDLIFLDTCENIEIFGLTFDGNRNNLGAPVQGERVNGNCSAIYLHTCDGVNIHDCVFNDILTFGVFSRGSGADRTLPNIKNLRIVNNYFKNCMNAAKIIEGISENIIFSDNICESMDTHGISLYPTAKNVVISNNTIEAGINGEYISESGTGIRMYETQGVTCIGNIIKTAHQYGILVENDSNTENIGKDITISNNTVLSSDGAGVVIRSSNTIVSDNIINGFKSNGIYTDTGEDILIKNNIVDASASFEGSPNIYIATDKVSVIGNKIINAKGVGIDLTSSSTECIARDNEVLGGDELETGIRISSPCVIGFNKITGVTKYYYKQNTSAVFTTPKLIYIGKFNISGTATFEGKIDGIADSVVINHPCTVVKVEAFVENAITAGSVRFRIKKNNNIANYDFAPQITSGKTASSTVYKGHTSLTSEGVTNLYFDAGDVLTVDCVTGSGMTPTTNVGMIIITFDCDRV